MFSQCFGIISRFPVFSLTGNLFGHFPCAVGTLSKSKAYIPLRRKTTGVGANAKICFRYTNMLVSKNAKICLTSNAKHKIFVSPNASQWNIGCIGFPTQNLRVGHVHFMMFVLISLAFVTQREPSLQWNMGLTLVSVTTLTATYRLPSCRLPPPPSGPACGRPTL